MMSEKPGVPYSEIRDKMATMDLLLFRGSDAVSKTIAGVESLYTGSGGFTHAGIVIRPEDLPMDSDYRRRCIMSADPKNQIRTCVCVLESTASGKFIDGVPSVTDGGGHLGVQMRNLDQVVQAYDANPVTRLAWLPLNPTVKRGIRDNNLSEWKLQDILNRYLSTPYDASICDLGAAAVPCMRCMRDNCAFRWIRDSCSRVFCCGSRPSTWLFCSELVSQIYVELGIFPKTVNPSNVMPVDFLPKGFEDDETAPLNHTATTSAPALSQPPVVTTMDSDGQVPWVFSGVVRYHS